MNWIEDDNSNELLKSMEGYSRYLRKNKERSHQKEMKRFIQKLNYIEFQELIELWARHSSRKKDIAISARSEYFYKSQEWRRIRYLKLREQKTCEQCGWGSDFGKRLHVDHILSRWLYGMPNHLNQTDLVES